MAKVLLLISEHDHNDWIVRLLERDGLCTVTRTGDPFEYARQVEVGGWDLILSTCIIDAERWPLNMTTMLFNQNNELPICFLSFTRPTTGIPWISKNDKSENIRQGVENLLFDYEVAKSYFAA